MKYALDRRGQEISADDGVDGTNYTCPVCSERTAFQTNKFGTHYFKHWPGSNSEDCENYRGGQVYYSDRSKEVNRWLGLDKLLEDIPEDLLIDNGSIDETDEFLSWLDAVFPGKDVVDFAWEMKIEEFISQCLTTNQPDPELNVLNHTDLSFTEKSKLLWRLAHYLGIVHHYHLKGVEVPDKHRLVAEKFKTSAVLIKKAYTSKKYDQLIFEIKEEPLRLECAADISGEIQKICFPELMQTGCGNIDPVIKNRIINEGILLCKLEDESTYISRRHVEIGDEVLLLGNDSGRLENYIKNILREELSCLNIDGISPGWKIYQFQVPERYNELMPSWIRYKTLCLEGGLKIAGSKYLKGAVPNILLRTKITDLNKFTLKCDGDQIDFVSQELESGLIRIQSKLEWNEGQYLGCFSVDKKEIKFEVVNPPMVSIAYDEQSKGGWGFTKNMWPELRRQSIDTDVVHLRGPIQMGEFTKGSSNTSREQWFKLIRNKKESSKISNPRLRLVTNRKVFKEKS
ncbi:hypothetical protein LNTAR_15127 [Lentisphaera araneosa HTCC2155]|uniref:Uncharacterized protein n=1 Tax=Lentisphaera araneosa HTCC2155 TaxID=313628 RepID=A6DRF0_9BACT|nr:hypothetical protein [Lentisphaera araneosa]EDM25760.1 hypothetical protein LNTAR_15127 [Lentisphaera araneosa HTCC2155]